MPQDPYLGQRPDSYPGPADDILPADIAHHFRAAVSAVVTVVPHDEIFVFAQKDRI